MCGSSMQVTPCLLYTGIRWYHNGLVAVPHLAPSPALSGHLATQLTRNHTANGAGEPHHHTITPTITPTTHPPAVSTSGSSQVSHLTPLPSLDLRFSGWLWMVTTLRMFRSARRCGWSGGWIVGQLPGLWSVGSAWFCSWVGGGCRAASQMGDDPAAPPIPTQHSVGQPDAPLQPPHAPSLPGRAGLPQSGRGRPAEGVEAGFTVRQTQVQRAFPLLTATWDHVPRSKRQVSMLATHPLTFHPPPPHTLMLFALMLGVHRQG